jgi:hypothetical protein
LAALGTDARSAAVVWLRHTVLTVLTPEDRSSTCVHVTVSLTLAPVKAVFTT